jgi:flagellar hook-basal body complex protein FliE
MNAAITKEVQQGTLMHNDSLTLSFFAAILCLPCNIYKVGICSPRKGEKSPLSTVVFFRPQFLISTGLIRVQFIMVDCFRETLKSFARSFAGTANLIQSTAHCFAATGGGKFTLQRNTAMSHHQSAPNAQTSIALNPQTLLNAIHWLERAQQHTSDLVDVFATHENDLKLVEIEIEITTALNALANAVMQGVPITPLPQAEPAQQSPNGRQTTNHRTEQDGAGYDCRVLLDDGDDYHEINPQCTPPAGYRQVCIKCGFDEFATGVIYLDCPQCRLQVVHYCRYVALNGGV